MYHGDGRERGTRHDPRRTPVSSPRQPVETAFRWHPPSAGAMCRGRVFTVLLSARREGDRQVPINRNTKIAATVRLALYFNWKLMYGAGARARGDEFRRRPSGKKTCDWNAPRRWLHGQCGGGSGSSSSIAAAGTDHAPTEPPAGHPPPPLPTHRRTPNVRRHSKAAMIERPHTQYLPPPAETPKSRPARAACGSRFGCLGLTNPSRVPVCAADARVDIVMCLRVGTLGLVCIYPVSDFQMDDTRTAGRISYWEGDESDWQSSRTDLSPPRYDIRPALVLSPT